MKNEIILNLRQFPVLAHDHQDGQEKRITVTVAKNQLQAAQIVGQSSKELIERLCDRQGYSVMEIGKPSKVAVTVDLDTLVGLARGLDATEGIKSFLDRFGATDREDRQYWFALRDDGNITLEDSDDGGGGTDLDFSKKGCVV